jgi:hypothetical protein
MVRTFRKKGCEGGGVGERLSHTKKGCHFEATFFSRAKKRYSFTTFIIFSPEADLILAK